MLQKATSLLEQFPLLKAFDSHPFQAAVEYYATCLNDKAIAFVQATLQLSQSDAVAMQFGFSDRSLGNRLPSNYARGGKQIRSKLEAIGLYKPNGREALRGYVTIPLFDEHGTITGIEGLRLDPKAQISERIVIGNGARLQESGVRLQESGVRLQEESCGQAHSDETRTADSSATPPPASSLSPPACTPAYCLTPTACTITRGDRIYTIRGLERNMSSLSLKVSIAVSRLDLMHLDTVDLMRASARQAFVRAAASELFAQEETIKKDLGWILLQLEDLRNQQIDAAKAIKRPAIVISDSDRELAMALLRDPQLTHRIVADLEACGMVGEGFNKLAAYLAVISRKLANPLAILIQSSSSAGKTTLMDHVLAMAPPEDYLRLSNLTSQSLYYLDSSSIQHKTLAISEDHGLAEAAYALKLLQSEGKLTHATVAKGSDGIMRTQLQQVQGPVQLLLTSTSKDIDEELANRCLILTVDETPEQTLAIQERQRLLQTKQGQQSRTRTEQLQTLHQNAQRSLRPLRVYNSLVDQLQFPSDRTRNRRDHQKFLTLIQSIALLHQFQRPITTDDQGIESIEVLESDIELANRLMTKILAQSLDELQSQTKHCLDRLTRFVSEQCQKQAITKRECRFNRRAFREATGWTDNQIRTHLDRLVSLEYVIVHRGKQGCTYVYELC